MNYELHVQLSEDRVKEAADRVKGQMQGTAKRLYRLAESIDREADGIDPATINPVHLPGLVSRTQSDVLWGVANLSMDQMTNALGDYMAAVRSLDKARADLAAVKEAEQVGQILQAQNKG